jgi:prepilin peptidase CpaA
MLWGVLFTLLLLVAAVVDVRERRIPNVNVVALLIGGLAFSLSTRPLGDALLGSLLGGALGFALFIAFWPMGLIGAGDVKLFAAVGVWLGPSATMSAALVTALVGGVLAVFSLARSGQLRTAFQRVFLAVSTRSAAVLAPVAGETPKPAGHLPYGVAIAAGALVTAWRPLALS